MRQLLAAAVALSLTSSIALAQAEQPSAQKPEQSGQDSKEKQAQPGATGWTNGEGSNPKHPRQPGDTTSPEHGDGEKGPTNAGAKSK